MTEPLTAGLWGLLAASSLVIGAVIGVGGRIPRQAVALVMGFGAGALISALAFDLAAEAFAAAGALTTAAGLAAGAATFYLGNAVLQRGGRERRRKVATTGGTALLLGALLDGIPESIVLGASLLGGFGVSLSFLAAVFISNVPEGIAGARDLSDEGHPRGRIIGLWAAVALASGLAAGVGNALLGDTDPWVVALVQAFAGGAILTMLADSMMPESFEHGGDTVGLATVFGFAVAFLLARA
jgi:ZIP family zinc transporter